MMIKINNSEKRRKSSMDVNKYLSELANFEKNRKERGSLTEVEDKRKRTIEGILTRLIQTEGL